MLTLSRSPNSSRLTDSSRRSAGLSSDSFNRDNALQFQFRVQNRSSAAQSNRSAVSSRNGVGRLLLLQGRNPVVRSISGNGTQATQGVLQMHNGGSWEFFSGGQFRFTPAGLGTVARTDLYPIVGNYRSTSTGGISFFGSRSSANLTSRNTAAVSGSIEVRNGAIVARVAQRTVLTNAAVINGTPFGNTIDRTVVLDMNMVRIA